MRIISLEDEDIVVDPTTVPADTNAEVPAEVVATPEELVEQQEEVIEVGSDDVETELLISDSDTQNDFNEEEKTSVAVESLAMFAAITKDLIATRRCSMESLSLIRVGVAPHLAALNVKPLVIATESDKSIEELHQMALEGFWNNIAQNWVVSYKHLINATTDFFKNKEKQVEKYVAVLDKAESEWKEKLPKLQRNQQDVSLDQLWYYFRKTSGQVDHPSSELKLEEDLSTYVLTKYTNDVLGELEKLASILTTAKFDSSANVIALAKKVEGLRSPIEMFDKKFVSGKQFMNATQLVLEQGTKRSAISIDDTLLEKLSKLATPSCVSTSGSFTHNALKVAANSNGYGTLAAFALSKNLIIGNDDVAKLIKSSGKMLENVESYFNSATKFSAAVDKLTKGLSGIRDTADGSPEAVKVLNQINQVARNYINAYKRTGVEVAAHSIKGAKYTGYLVNRIIWNAK